jgi:cation diffusion facilitator family transporter
MTCSQLHRHGRRVHQHASTGPHRHLPRLVATSVPVHHGAHEHDDPAPHHHPHGHIYGHTHGLVDPTITRSREGIRAVAWSLAVLGTTAAAQGIVFVASGSVALLADLVHNGGDALTAVPLALAFALHSRVAERRAGLAVVAAVFVSACVAGVESISRLVHPSTPGHLFVLALAGAIGYLGNFAAARIRIRTGERLDSPALVADGHHARADAYVSLTVVASAAFVAIGADLADPLLGLVITAVILRITWDSWRTVRGGGHEG